MDAREYPWMPGNTHGCQGIPMDNN